MKIAEVMTRNPRTIAASDSIFSAARTFAEMEVGALPVEQGDRLIGMLTDRDIVVRVLAEHRDPNTTKVEDVASKGTKYCFEDEDVKHVARNMDQLFVRRLPVLNRDKRLVGIVSIEDIRPRR